MIKVSVVIPVYNDPNGLHDTLESLVTQNFPKDQYEIIVADNGSVDRTSDVIKEYLKNYPYLINCVVEDKIQSSYAARNKGINIAEGSILALIDADCIPIKDWLRNGFNTIRKSKASMVAGKITFSYLKSRPNIWEYFDSAEKLNQKFYVENVGFGATANLFVQRTMFDKYGLFIPELRSGGDYEFGRRLTQAGEVLQYDETTLVFHPARSTFRVKLAKSKRVAEGQKMLARMGLLNHGQLNLKQLILTKSYPSIAGVNVSIDRKILLVLVNNFFRYYNFIKRL